MTKFSALERNLLIALARAENGLDVYTLYTRVRGSPAELFHITSRLARQGFAVIDKSRITMTKAGNELMLANSRYLSSSDDKHWRDIPDRFRREALLPYETYIPNTTRVHRSVLPPEWKGFKN